MAVRFLSGAVCFGVRALVALAATSATASVQDEAGIEPGVRVRVRTGPRVEIPGVARFSDAQLWGADVAIDEKKNVVALSDGKGGRLTLPRPNHTFVGHVVSAEDGALVVSLDGKSTRVTIPGDAVKELEVSLGREKKRGRASSALRGLGIGAGGGIVLGLVSGDDDPGLLAFTAGQKAQIFGVFFGVIGGIVGAASGGGEMERWHVRPSPGSSKLKVSLKSLGVSGASVGISF